MGRKIENVPEYSVNNFFGSYCRWTEKHVSQNNITSTAKSGWIDSISIQFLRIRTLAVMSWCYSDASQIVTFGTYAHQICKNVSNHIAHRCVYLTRSDFGKLGGLETIKILRSLIKPIYVAASFVAIFAVVQNGTLLLRQ